MIKKEQGVHALALNRQEWPGVAHVGLKLKWETEPGWIALSFDAPALFAVTREVGGRSELRLEPGRPADGEYFGTGHLSLVAAGQSAVIYAAEMREADLACFLIDLPAADYLSPQQASAIAVAGSRLMFKNDRAYSCASLLSGGDGESGPFQASLSRALLAALVGTPPAPEASGLTGIPLAGVLAHIRDYLDETITIDDLAEAAGMPPSQFSRAFRDATGSSPRRWQMDARVRSAQRLMIDDPTGSLAEVAALTGFSDQSHFSRAFLDIVGLTPTAWLHQRP